MGLFNLLTKDGRDAAKSKREYEECRVHRKDKINSFRANAVNDVMFQYPDARLLLNSLDRRFLVLLRSKGELVVGQFADDYFPRLEYVEDEADSSERFAAVNRYWHDVKQCQGNIAQSLLPRLEKEISWKRGCTFMTKGYRLCYTTELEFLAGGALFLDDSKIAISSAWDPKPKGYMTGTLLEEVVQARSTNTGITKLSFVMVESNPIGEWHKIGYQIISDSSLMRFNEEYRKEYSALVLCLRDFMYEVEDFLGEDVVLELVSEECKQALNSADQYADGSIERACFW